MPGAQTASPRLLERDEALSAIAERIESAMNGNGRLMIVEGPSGIGKTQVLDAARAEAASQGLAVLRARGSAIERDFAFGVARQLFEAPLRSLPAAARRKLLDGAAGLAAPVVTGEVATPATSIFPILHALYWLCSNLAARGPLLVMVDDAHWADEQSLRWLSFLARRLEEIPALVLLARRPADPDAPSPLLDTLAAEPGTHVLRLEPLSQEAAGVLTEQALGAEGDKEFVLACHMRTGGNPFLLGELLAAVAAEGMPPTSESAARVPELRPETVSRTVLVRLGGLSDAARRLAQAAAVLESDIQLRHAAALAEVDHDQASDAAATLAAAEITVSGEPLGFVHALVRDAIYHDMPPPRRSRAHRRAAELLATENAKSERVATHLLKADCAGDPWVVDRLVRAADEALARGGPGAGIAYLERAVLEPPPPDALGGVLRALGEAQLRVAPAASAERLSEALTLTGEPSERSAVAGSLANALLACGRPADAFDVLETAITALPADTDRELRLRLEAELLGIGLLAPALAQRVGEHVRELPALEGTTPGERLVLANVARHGALTGLPPDQAAALAQAALAGGALLRDQAPDGPTFQWPLLALAQAERYAEADEMIALVFEDARARGSLLGMAIGYATSSNTSARRGDVRALEADARRGLELSEETGWLPGIPVFVESLVVALVERDALDEAQGLLERHGMNGDLPDSFVFFTHLLASRGRLRLAQGETSAGLADLLEVGRREAASGWSVERLRWRSLAAPALAALGNRDDAVAMAQADVERSRELGARRPLGMALRALGIVAGGRDGLDHLREAVAVLEPSQARLEYARALADLGAALRRANQRAAAREPLREALDLAHRCGATALAAHAETELRATGARPRKIMVTGVESLTPSERRVAEMAARGLSNPAIAQSLFVTRKTVELHLGNAYRKLDISSRAKLAAALGQNTQ